MLSPLLVLRDLVWVFSTDFHSPPLLLSSFVFNQLLTLSPEFSISAILFSPVHCNWLLKIVYSSQINYPFSSIFFSILKSMSVDCSIWFFCGSVSFAFWSVALIYFGIPGDFWLSESHLKKLKSIQDSGYSFREDLLLLLRKVGLG